MNKLLMDGESLELTSEINNIEVNGNTTINIINLGSDIDLTIKLNDNSETTINDFNLQNKNINLKVIQNNNSKFTYNHSFSITGDYKLNYQAYINGNNNYNNFNIYGVSRGNAYINADGIINKCTKGNILNENIKVLTINGKCHISPMLHVSALDVIANHNTAISNINKDDLFYLMSKGISEIGASKLIENGYLYGIFKNNPEFLEQIKNI